MDKNRLLKLMGQLIQQICDMNDQEFNQSIKDNRVKFRQYDRLSEFQDNRLTAIDVTVEF